MRKKNEPCADDKKGMRKPGRSGRTLTAAGLPADSDCRMPVVTITGGRYLKAEHHMGVLLLTETCVRLYSRMGIIRIEGRRLAASDMDGDLILLEGEVRSVSFEK